MTTEKFSRLKEAFKGFEAKIKKDFCEIPHLLNILTEAVLNCPPKYTHHIKIKQPTRIQFGLFSLEKNRINLKLFERIMF